jgi:hypothetical protein
MEQTGAVGSVVRDVDCSNTQGCAREETPTAGETSGASVVMVVRIRGTRAATDTRDAGNLVLGDGDEGGAVAVVHVAVAGAGSGGGSEWRR